MRLARLLTLLLLSSLCLPVLGQVEIQILPPQIWSGPSADTLGFLMPTRANNGAKWASNATAKAAILPAGTSGQTLRYNGTTLTASSLFTNDGTNLAIPSFTTPGYIANDASGNLSSATAASIGAAIGAFKQGGNSFTANGVLGTTDNYPMTFLTNNVERMRISQAGQVQFNNYTSSSAFSGTTDHFVTQSSSGQILTKSSAQFLSDLGISGAVTGTGSSNLVALWSGPSTLTSDPGISWSSGKITATNLQATSLNAAGYVTNDASGNLSTVTTATIAAAVNHWLLTSGDVSRTTGAVGIGSGMANPTYKLQVVGAQNGVVACAQSNTASDILFYGNSTSAITGSSTLLTSNVSASTGVVAEVKNTNSATSTADAVLRSTVNGASAGDPFTNYKITGVSDWSVGVDNSDSDRFKVSSSSALGTSDRLYISTSGTVTIPSLSSAGIVTNNSSGDLSTSTFASLLGTAGGTTGSGASGRVALWNGTSTLTSDAGLTYSGSSITSTGTVNAAVEFRLANSFTRVATADANGGFGGGYNFDWTTGAPLHDVTAAASGYSYTSGGIRFYANTSQAGGSTVAARMEISTTGVVRILNLATAGYVTNDASGNLSTVTAAVIGASLAPYTNYWTLSGSDVNRSVGYAGAPEFRLSGLSYSRIGVLDDAGGWFGGYNVKWDASLGVVHDSPGTASSIRYGTAGISFQSDATASAGAQLPTTPRLFIASAGNIGVRTSSPSYELDVVGTIRAQTDLISSNNATIIGSAAIGTASFSGDKLTVGGTGNMGITILHPTNGGGDYAAMRFVMGGAERGSFYANSNNMTLSTGGYLILSPTSAVRIPAFTNAGNILSNDGSGTISSVTPASLGLITSSTAYINGGNSFGANATIGTNDNYTLGFKTNNTVRATLDASGSFGLNTTGPDRRLDVLDASNPQLRLTYTDGSVYTDFKTTSAGGLEISPSGGRIDLIPGADGTVYNARRQVEAYLDVSVTGSTTLAAGRSVYRLTGTLTSGDTWSITLPPSSDMIDGEVIYILNHIPGVSGTVVQVSTNTSQTLLGSAGSLGIGNSAGLNDRKALKLMFVSGGTWQVMSFVNL